MHLYGHAVRSTHEYLVQPILSSTSLTGQTTTHSNLCTAPQHTHVPVPNIYTHQGMYTRAHIFMYYICTCFQMLWYDYIVTVVDSTVMSILQKEIYLSPCQHAKHNAGAVPGMKNILSDISWDSTL